MSFFTPRRSACAGELAYGAKCVNLIWQVWKGSELVRLEGQLRSSVHLG